MRRLPGTLALLLAITALAPGTAEARRSSCAARHTFTVESNGYLRLYVRGERLYACSYDSGRRFEIGKGSEPYDDGYGNYGIEHVRVVGPRVAYTVYTDGVDYTVAEVWMRDVRRGRTFLHGVSPFIAEPGAGCVPGDNRQVDSLVLSAHGAVVWSSTYACTEGERSRSQVILARRGARPELLDADAEGDCGPVALDENSVVLFWLHGHTPRFKDVA